jgi:hypothetical protein
MSLSLTKLFSGFQWNNAVLVVDKAIFRFSMEQLGLFIGGELTDDFYQ